MKDKYDFSKAIRGPVSETVPKLMKIREVFKDDVSKSAFNELTHEILKAAVNYNPDTGIFTWLKKGGGRIYGCEAGNCGAEGYIRITINYKEYLAHRLAWFYMKGEWPKCQIDHINHCRDDNRIENLRDVDNSGNKKNAPLQLNNTTGTVGVYWDKARNKWSARIQVNGTLLYLGRYKKLSDAKKARKIAEDKYGFHENHGAARK